MSDIILNEILPWDGSNLGRYKGCSQWSWKVEGRLYYGIHLPQGILYYCRKRYRNNFPLLVYHLTHLFGLSPRGVHLIELDGVKYFIYYVPYRHNFLWHELSLSSLPITHFLRSSSNFCSAIRQIILLCDILNLSVRESTIIIHDDIPFNSSDSDNLLSRGEITIPGTLFERWFGELISPESVARNLLQQATGENDSSLALQILRRKVECIIHTCDKDYIWYANCVLDRCARYILK